LLKMKKSMSSITTNKICRINYLSSLLKVFRQFLFFTTFTEVKVSNFYPKKLNFIATS
jgi:hypothetical protein